MVLLKECIECLGNECEIYDQKKSQDVFDLFQSRFPFTEWGRIDWGKVKNKVVIENSDEILKVFNYNECMILWDEASLPVVKSNINRIMSCLNDVLAVSFDTWILDISYKCVIEFYHENQITIGFL